MPKMVDRMNLMVGANLRYGVSKHVFTYPISACMLICHRAIIYLIYVLVHVYF